MIVWRLRPMLQTAWTQYPLAAIKHSVCSESMNLIHPVHLVDYLAELASMLYMISVYLSIYPSILAICLTDWFCDPCVLVRLSSEVYGGDTAFSLGSFGSGKQAIDFRNTLNPAQACQEPTTPPAP
eukprot:401636-Amphidinium_carterae.1